MRLEWVLLGASLLLVLSVLASKASGRLGVPALLLFILIGMVAGSEGPGGLYFDDYALSQSLGVVALAFILFAGGLDTRWQEVRPAFGKAILLSTLGVLLTALLVGLFVHLVLDLSLLQGFLVGSIVSSTDAAAVFAVLRARNVRLAGQLKPLLELESGSNDPMAVFLTIGVIQLLAFPSGSLFGLVSGFLLQMSVGLVAGLAMGRLMVWVANRIHLAYEGLYPVLTLAWVPLTYGLAAILKGNGFLAVYLCGLLMGNSTFVHKRSLMRFHDGIAWLMQITMFLTLGLLVFPSQLVPVAGLALATALFLMVVARPAAVFAALAFSRMSLREKTLVGWVGLRGAVPIVLATFPLLAGVPKAEQIFNVVFFVVLTSVLLQGPSIPFVARLLRLEDEPERDPVLIESNLPLRRESELITVAVPLTSSAVGEQIVELGLPNDAVVLLIHRDGGFFAPTGTTILRAGDKLMALTSKRSVDRLRAIVES